MNKLILSIAFAAAGILGLSAQPSDGIHSIEIFSTNDIHGTYFDSLYVGNKTRNSLLAVSKFINLQRDKYGKDKVVLIDAGDFLQGDNASYYYDYVAGEQTHVYTLMSEYMQYDALVMGNHDVEAGPEVYNRFKEEVKVPLLAANAIERSTGKCHFGEYTMIERDGFRIAVIGLTNPNMKNWIDEDKMGGMDFVDPMGGLAQKLVDRLRKEEKPDIVIFAIHSGTGDGDGKALESQGLDLYHKIKGVDVFICAHDHKAYCDAGKKACFINSGSHCRNVGHATVSLTVSKGKVVGKEFSVETPPIDKKNVDVRMAKHFHKWYSEVKKFSIRKIGKLEMPLASRQAYVGMCDNLNLLHTIQLKTTGAAISFAAPLKFNAYVKAGKVIYNDLFTLYPFENKLYVVNMTGEEIVKYLEASYDSWINTVSAKLNEKEHLLKIVNKHDDRNGGSMWSFENRSYNFDSAAGINYTVDVTAPAGKRISVSSMADGSAFDLSKTYEVAMTSYRASGGGYLLAKAGIEDSAPRTVKKHEELREIMYRFFLDNGTVSSALVSDVKLLGQWKFIPEDLASPLLKQDMNLLFPKRK